MANYDCFDSKILIILREKKIEHVSFDICQNYINPIDYISTPF